MIEYILWDVLMYCKAFQNHLCFSVDGKIKPCCRFQENNFEKMKNGWYIGCQKCYDEEKLGIESYRQYLDKLLSGEKGLEYIEFSISNNCNLYCRMCNSTNSSMWYNVIKNNKEIKNFHDLYLNKSLSVKEIFDRDISKLKRIKYLGGEPFITKENTELLDILEDRNVIKNMTFWTNTNVTVFPKKIISRLNKFKEVIVALSIDGIGLLNDYIRSGSNWKNIENNIKKWKTTKFKVYVHTTVQAYNIHALDLIKNFCEKNDLYFHCSQLISPDYLNVNSLNQKYINSIETPLNKPYIKNFIYNKDSNKKLIEYTSMMDNITNSNILEINPLWIKNI